MKRDEINSLLMRYGPIVYRRALQILGHEADAKQAVEEIFVSAIRHAEGFESRRQISSWLYGITITYCLTKIRDSKRRQEIVEEQGLHPELADGFHNSTISEKITLVRRLLSMAKPDEARAALYVYIDGMSHAEASTILEVSRKTVGNMLENFNEWSQGYLAVHETEELEALERR
ncbi:MAG TPA: RNA polymerase sigma factor [Nitrospinaceae bacterium]|nr:RNA polymerase sigma factor [Nitrospinaceae bacterium]